MIPFDALGEIVVRLNLNVRLEVPDLGDAGWSRWLVVPVPSYVETGRDGPVRQADVVAVHIDPIVSADRVGRHASQNFRDRTAQLEAELTTRGIRYSISNSGCIQVRQQ